MKKKYCSKVKFSQRFVFFFLVQFDSSVNLLFYNAAKELKKNEKTTEKKISLSYLVHKKGKLRAITCTSKQPHTRA